MIEPFVGLKEESAVSPADKVISQLKELISSGILKPGDKLPAERKLAQEFGLEERKSGKLCINWNFMVLSKHYLKVAL